MKYLILVSHGEFAEGVKTSLEMFAGDAVKQVCALCLHNGKSAAEFKSMVEEFLDEQQFKAEDEFVVLADIIGGSPLTTFLDVFAARGYLERAVILGGMNFTMALTATVSLNSMSRQELAKSALSEAQAALKEYKVPSAETDDEDDI